MPATKRIKALRLAAYHRQKGRCWWCGEAMVLEPENHGGQPDRLCTAEHLMPSSVGGRTNRSNVVAACRVCNNGRQSSEHAYPGPGYAIPYEVPDDPGRVTLADVWPTTMEMS